MTKEKLEEKVNVLIRQIQKEEYPIYAAQFSIIEIVLNAHKDIDYYKMLGLLEEAKNKIQQLKKDADEEDSDDEEEKPKENTPPTSETEGEEEEPDLVVPDEMKKKLEEEQVIAGRKLSYIG